MIYHYCRVSSKEQNVDRQLKVLTAYKKADGVFVDKQSGKNFCREDYQRLKSVVVEGDEITFVADSLSPFAIMSYAENADVQPKAVIWPWLLALLLLLLIAALIAWLVSNKKKSADAPKQ